MAAVRVYLLTHRRPHLLRRALASLRAQTMTDWTCELHNDAPDDESPGEILAQLAPGDNRFEYHHHKRNLGAVATFNIAFAGGPEPMASVLEDDNWWDPTLLQTLTNAIESQPTAALAWANMRLWEERVDGTWRDTGNTIWNIAPDAPPVVTFATPELFQSVDALHSNGAMVFRPARFRSRSVPRTAPLALIEPLRERAAMGELLFITQSLSNFACTRQSARDSDATRWLQAKLLLAASFFTTMTPSPVELCQLWVARRAMTPPDTDMFFQLALALRRPRFVAPATSKEWLFFFLRSLRHPVSSIRALQFAREHPETWYWLLEQTKALNRGARVTLLEKRIPPSHNSIDTVTAA